MDYLNSRHDSEIAKTIKEKTLTYLYYQNAPLHYRFKEFVTIPNDSANGAVNFNTAQAQAQYNLSPRSAEEKQRFNADLQHYQSLLYNTYKRVKRDMMAFAD